MINPFKEKSNSSLITGIVVGGVVAAGLAFLFLTEDGEELLNSLKHMIKDKAKDFASEVVSDRTGIKKQTVKKAADIVTK